MSIKNISLDLSYVKDQFPAFKDPLSSKWSFFENAGGSYVPHNERIYRMGNNYPFFQYFHFDNFIAQRRTEYDPGSSKDVFQLQCQLLGKTRNVVKIFQNGDDTSFCLPNDN